MSSAWPQAAGDTLRAAIAFSLVQQFSQAVYKATAAAKNASVQLITWLQKQLPFKTGPSGIGKENYNWHLKHVLLVPLTWDDEVMLLKRELTRAYASLQLEWERNKNLPELKPIATVEQYKTQTDADVTNMMRFLKEKKILLVKEYMEPELRKRSGGAHCGAQLLQGA